MRRLAPCPVLLVVALFISLPALADEPALQRLSDAERAYDLAAREAQYRSLVRINDADVEYGRFGRVRQVAGHTFVFIQDAAKLRSGDSAANLLLRFKPMLLASGSESLVIRGVVPAPESGYYVFTDQVIGNVPVVDAHVNFIVSADGEVQMMNSLFVPQGEAATTPQLSLGAAKERLEQALFDTETADVGSLEFAAEGSVVFWTDDGNEQTPRLLWMIEANFTSHGEPKAVRFGVDAETGELRYSETMRFGLNRTVWSNNFRNTVGSVPGSLIFLWGEGTTPLPNEPAAANVYNKVLDPIQAWAGTVFAYNTLGLAVHYGLPGSTDARQSWYARGTDGKGYLIFGDTAAMQDDDIAHEYGHGLFVNHVPEQPEYRLKVWDEWFAGNEFYADYSAVVTDIWRRNGSVDPIQTWAIWTLRDWRDPTSMPGGTFMNRDWYGDWRYAGGGDVPYSNSTIFGHAVYLMINGGTHKRAGQIAWGQMIPSINVPAAPPAQIKAVLMQGIYRLQLYNRKFSGPQFRDETVAAAQQLYGSTSPVVNTVDLAWKAVGIRANCSVPPPVPTPSYENYFCEGMHHIMWPTLSGTKYHGEMVRTGYPWDLATTTLDVGSSGVGTGSCTPNVQASTMFHMRACNACGCSNWSAGHTLQYYQTCL